jgi:hypothetical protein
MNGRETAQAVLDQILYKPETHNQGEWVVSETQEIREDFCGTTGCVAGWTILLTDFTMVKFQSAFLGGGYEFACVVQNGEYADIEQVASELLEITPGEGEYLFDANRTNDEVYTALKEIIATGTLTVSPGWDEDEDEDDGF